MFAFCLDAEGALRLAIASVFVILSDGDDRRVGRRQVSNLWCTTRGFGTTVELEHCVENQ